MASFFDNVIEGIEKEANGDMIEALREKGKKEKRATIEKTAAGARPMASAVTNSLKPTLVVGYNPQNQKSVLFVQRLDKALNQVSGLERLKVVVLNPMLDRAVIDKLEIPIPGAVIYRGRKKLGEISGGLSPMQISKYLSENKGKLIS